MLQLDEKKTHLRMRRATHIYNVGISRISESQIHLPRRHGIGVMTHQLRDVLALYPVEHLVSPSDKHEQSLQENFELGKVIAQLILTH